MRLKSYAALSFLLLAALTPFAGAQTFFTSFSGGEIDQVSSSSSSVFGTTTGPEGMSVDGAGNLYVADDTDNVVYKFSPDGTRTVFASGLNAPSDVAIDAAGYVYVANTNEGTIMKYSPDGMISSVFASLITGPEALTFDLSGNLFVAQAAGITKYSPDGATSTLFAALPNATTLTFDSDFTHLYASASSGGVITYYDLDGTAHVFTTSISFIAADITFDASGNLFVVDADNDRILKFDSSGNSTTFASFTTEPLSFALIPEPATWWLFVVGLCAIVVVRRRRLGRGAAIS
jgi:streptogramin lyase